MTTLDNSSEYIGWRLEAFVGVFTPLQVLFVALRIYARSLSASPWAWDDGLVIVALLGQFVAAGIAIGSVRQGAVGHHVGYLQETNPGAITIFFKYLVAISCWYYATIWISKLAICLLFHRLFPQKPVRVAIIVVATMLVCTSVVSLIANLAACRPFSAQWAPVHIQHQKCFDKRALFVWSTLPNILTDAIMLILPLPLVWKLHTSTQMKGALTVTFLVGGSGLVASILRFWAFSQTNSFVDATYNAVQLIIWTLVEPGIYLLSACMLVYRPLLNKLTRGSFRIGTRAKTRRGYGQQESKAGSTGHKGEIELHKYDGEGFTRLADDCTYNAVRSAASTTEPKHGGDPNEILITTNIQQSWDNL